MIVLALWSVSAAAQVTPVAPATGASGIAEKLSPVERGIELAAKRQCDEALPLLNEYVPGGADKQLEYKALMAKARCGMRKKDGRATVSALMALRHDFPQDPEVLYLTTQVFLEIAVGASQELTAVAPGSYQVLELEAETLESQGKWEEAAAIYRKIVAENPKLPNIHLRLGHAEIMQPDSAANSEDARKNFEQELALDPTNASAEFWLGELARRDGQWDQAIPHFNAALKLDPSLPEASLGLGMTLNSQGRFSDAILPLERFTKLAPDDPAGHYQLAIAYARTGRKEDSARELARQQELAEKKTGSSPAASEH